MVSGMINRLFPGVSPEVAITYKLSAFHTAFNICNVLILIWFIGPIEKVVCWVIRPKEDEEEFRLRFISGGMLSTAELSIVQARKEINLFAERTAVCLVWCVIYCILRMRMISTNYLAG